MSIEGLAVSVLLLTVTVLLVAAPLLGPDTGRAGETARIARQRDRLLAYYERVLTNIRDLDEDHATGKMPDDEYAVEREEWVQRGIYVLRALDTLHDHSLVETQPSDEVAVDEALDSMIEAAIAARRRHTEQQPNT
jgi:hypothetical protein